MKNMKKLLLSLVVSVSLIACNINTQTKKTEAVNDKEAGSFTSMDDKSATVKKAIEAYMSNDTIYPHAELADTFKVYDMMSDNIENGKVKANLVGKQAFINGSKMEHFLYSDIKMTTNNIKTFVFNDGRTVSGYWGYWSGTGNFTKATVTTPVHLIYWWERDKIVSMSRFFDPSQLKVEIAASQKK